MSDEFKISENGTQNRNAQRYEEVEFKSLLKELRESIVHLQAMRDYAHENHYSETESHLNKVLEAFDALQKKYERTEIVTTTHIIKQIEKVRSALISAKIGMRVDSKEIFSSLANRSSLFQPIYENSRKFFLPQNKFETLLNKLDHFEKTHQQRKAKNSAQFSLFQLRENKKSQLPVSEKKHFNKSTIKK